MHRDPALWPEPDAFRPSRWADGLTAPLRHPLAYLPFSAGGRNCIGSHFAMLEARVCLAVLVARAEWTVDEGYVHRPGMAITLRPAAGLPLHMKPRALDA
jgi:cytochrome P450